MWDNDVHNAILYELLAPMSLIIYDFNHPMSMKKNIINQVIELKNIIRGSEKRRDAIREGSRVE